MRETLTDILHRRIAMGEIRADPAQLAVAAQLLVAFSQGVGSDRGPLRIDHG